MIHGHIVTPHAYFDFELLAVTNNHMMEFPAILPCNWTEGNKEIDDSSKEVLGRVREELVTSTASSLSCALVQGSKQSGRSLGGSTQIGDILPLDGIHTVGVLHIGKVDDIKGHVLRDIPKHLVLVEVVESHLCQCRELIIIDNERKTLSRMLPDKRLYHRKGLTAAWGAYYPSTTEGIDHITPALAHSSLIVEYHRYID